MNKVVVKTRQLSPATKPRLVRTAPVEPVLSEAIIPHNFTTTTTDGAKQWFEFMLRRAREKGIFMVKETMTPAIARLLLENNADNRPISAAKVEAMANEMAAGTFDSMNGQTIQISEDGMLNDGQHRCRAKLESTVDIDFHFMFGLRREARLTIDQGKVRTAGDYLIMSGHDGGKRAASVGYLLYLWRARGSIKDLGGGGKAGPARPSSSERAQYTRDHMDQIMATLNVVPSKTGVTQLGGYALLAFCHLIFAEKHFAGATDFINRLISGSELAENSPISICRRRLLTEKRLHRHERLELIIRAWNAYRNNTTPKNLMINNSLPDIAD